MDWVVIPRSAVEVLRKSKPLRTSLAVELANGTLTEWKVISAIDGSVAQLGPFDDRCVVLAAWAASDNADAVLRGQEFIAIWSNATSSTVFSMPEEILPPLLERICGLGQRIWEGKRVSDTWGPKRAGEHYSIFASGRYEDLRIAYDSQNEGGKTNIGVGTIFYSNRKNKIVSVPSVAAIELGELPQALKRPAGGAETGDTPEEDWVSDPDVLINRGRGEDRHLFSMRYADWLDKESPLTTQQRRIINDKTYPLRIHGPGGSGKTLVLLLKALGLLANAQTHDAPCKVLVVLHNNEVRNNVRAAIEAIDQGGFLATRKSDKQFLDVETLHGWCMRELEIDVGGIDYALHSDPIASKAKQDEILSKIVDGAVEERLPRNRGLVSSDLLAHFEGPRDKLVSNMRHEIAIRIKGRGMREEQQLYVESPLKSFVGRQETKYDRYFIFKIAEEYEKELQKVGRLDTDDVVLSMQSRLSAPLWNRQRKSAGYDFVFVDETHLFNENERRVLPYLTRGSQEFVPIIMTFDEAQSIGGRRAAELEEVGIRKSEQRRLSYVHRCSPAIYKLARDLVERSTLMFSEFSGGEAVSRMSDKDLKKCQPSKIIFCDSDDKLAATAVGMAIGFRSKNYPRVGVIAFSADLLDRIQHHFAKVSGENKLLKDRGDSVAGKPLPGTFTMTAENCGGLEFDAVILAGVDQGRVPPSLLKISPEGHMSAREEACKELYTSITRARYHVAFVCNRGSGLSEFVQPWIEGGVISEE